MLVHQGVAARLSHMLQRGNEDCLAGRDFSETEINIIKLIADGYTNKEIADRRGQYRYSEACN